MRLLHTSGAAVAAEGEGFEPPGHTPSGFQDRRIKPLCHPSVRKRATRLYTSDSILNRIVLLKAVAGWSTRAGGSAPPGVRSGALVDERCLCTVYPCASPLASALQRSGAPC